MAACNIVMSPRGDILGISTFCDGFVARPARQRWDDDHIIAAALYLARKVSAEISDEFFELCCDGNVQHALRKFGRFLQL